MSASNRDSKRIAELEEALREAIEALFWGEGNYDELIKRLSKLVFSEEKPND